MDSYITVQCGEANLNQTLRLSFQCCLLFSYCVSVQFMRDCARKLDIATFIASIA